MSLITRTVNRGALPIDPAYHEEISNIVAALVASKVTAGNPLLAVDDGTGTKCEAFGTFEHFISGKRYVSPPTAGISLPGTDDVTAAKWGAWRFERTALGAITATPAIAAGSDQAFESETLALAALGIIAATAISTTIGFLTLNADTGGFTVGTDSPVTSDAAVVVANYYNAIGDSVVEAAFTLAVSATPEQVAQGAGTVRRNGVLLAEIAAAATLAFDVADTVTTLKYGAWVFLTDIAGTAVIIQSADGDTAASLMAYATAAAAQAAIDAFVALLPNMIIPVGQLIIQNGVKAPWTAITDDLTDGSDVVVSTFTPITAGTHMVADDIEQAAVIQDSP